MYILIQTIDIMLEWEHIHTDITLTIPIHLTYFLHHLYYFVIKWHHKCQYSIVHLITVSLTTMVLNWYHNVTVITCQYSIIIVSLLWYWIDIMKCQYSIIIVSLLWYWIDIIKCQYSIIIVSLLWCWINSNHVVIHVVITCQYSIVHLITVSLWCWIE